MSADRCVVRSSVRCAVPVVVSVTLYSFCSSGSVVAQSAPPDQPAPSTTGQSRPAAPVVLPPITVRPRPDTSHSVVTPPPSSPTNQGAGQAVVVTPTTIPTPSIETAGSVTVLTSDDIDARQLRTVPDALATVPGLNVVQAGGPGSVTSVFLRGANSNHVKVLVDGIDVSDPSTANGIFDFGQLLTGEVARMEVLRGPQSGLYGSDAIGGVISVTTKQGSGPPKVTASVEGGSFGTTNERVGVSGSQDGFSYALNVQHFQSASVPVTPTNLLVPGEQRNNDFYDNWTYSTKLGAKISDTLSVNFVARYTEAKIRTTGEDCENFFPCAPEALQSTQLDHQAFTRAELVWSPSSGLRNYFGINYANEWTWFFDPNADNFFTSPLVSPPSTTVGTRLKYDYRGEFQVAPGQLLVFGAEHQNETLSTNSTNSLDAAGNATFFTTNAQRSDDAGWLQLQSEITPRLHVVSNIRYDVNQEYGDHTTWRIAPVYVVPVTDTKLTATYGTGFKAPTLNQLYVNFLPDFVGNPNLRPEESKGWDVGFEQPVANDRFRFGATYFRNDIRNLIEAGLAAPGVFTNVNVGVASMFGVESFAAWKVMNGLSLRADYTYTVAKDDTTGEQLLRRPKNKASVTAAWQPTSRLTLSSTVLYVGSWWDIDRSGFVSGLKAAPYTTVNLAASYAASEQVTYFARIDNLFNKQYEDPIGFEHPGFGIYGGIRLTLDGLSPPGGGAAAFIPPFLRSAGGM